MKTAKPQAVSFGRSLRSDRNPVKRRRIRPRLEWMEDRTLLTIFNVLNTADTGPGSLRQAILDSNAATGQANTIDFNISGAEVRTIAPLSPLPTITNPVLIDGESQPGYAGTPLIELNGSQDPTADGLAITAPNVTVRGLDIGNFGQGAGIHILGADATNDWIYGDFLGTDPTGTQSEPNSAGVEISGGASDNLIGTNGDGVNDAAERNLISGDLFAGVWIKGQGTNGNVVAGNLIGTSVTGDVALNNGASWFYYSQYVPIGGGVVIQGGASDNRIGTDGGSVDDVGERNVIAGSVESGIGMFGAGTDGNIVAGNYIGTDETGTIPLGVDGAGVYITEGASGNWVGVNPVGGAVVGDEGNVISGTGNDGVMISYNANSNVVAGDKIGTNATGTVALGNADYGVEIYTSSANTIGGTVAGAADVLSENTDAGVYLTNGASDNLVEGDIIETDAAGPFAAYNGPGGIDIESGSSDNTIGGSTAAAGNLITGNVGPGVVVGSGPQDTSVGNEITANRIFGNTGQAIDLGDDGVTYNGASPRQGPNNFQNFPILITTASGQLEGWLGGSLPDTSFRIDFYASSAYNADGSGEAEDFVGSMNVTTDATGQAVFTVPFTAPAGLPIITATATDPQGNTSEVSALRPVTLETPPPSLRIVPDRALIFSAASSDGLAIQDPDIGPLNPVWGLTLTVSAGTLSLSTVAGLTGSGDGSGSLSYSGPLSAVDAALDGLTFTPPAGPHVFATLTLNSQSSGASPLATQFTITDGVFVVTTTADSGAGSLRQAILESNAVTGATNTIDFDIPGPGARTIVPLSPLPPIATSVLVDGTTEPGYAGTPLIAFGGPQASATPLAVSNSDVTIRGLAIGSLAIDPTTTEGLIAVVDAPGVSSRLSLLDAQGNVLVQNDGVSSGSPESAIDEQLAAGDYSLSASGSGGQGTATWTIMLQPSAAAFQLIPVGSWPSGIVAGDFNGDGKLDLAVADEDSNEVSILLGNGDGTFQPAVEYAAGSNPSGIVAGDFTGNGKLDLAVADQDSNEVSILLGNGDGTFQPAKSYAAGSGPFAIVAGDFTGDGKLDLAVADFGSNEVSVLLGNGDGTFQPTVSYPVGTDPVDIVAGVFSGDGHLDLAVADWGNEFEGGSQGTDPGGVSVLMGNGDGTFQPAREYVAGTTPDAIAAGDFTSDGDLDLAVADWGANLGTESDLALGPSSVSVLIGNGDGTFQLTRQYAVAEWPTSIAVGDFTGDGDLDLAVADQTGIAISMLLGNGDGTFQPAQEYASGSQPHVIVAGDFNDDGRLDLAVANLKSYPAVTGTVSILLGNGDGTFQTSIQNQVPSAGNMVAGDFTGDGHLDLAITNGWMNSISILLGNGDGTFQPAVQYAVEAPYGIVAGDFNGDGRLDLAVNDSDGVQILLGNGDGTFQPAATVAAGLYGAMVVGDFNGDGKLDLAVSESGSNEVAILLGNGDGTFQPAQQYPAGSGPNELVAGDFTGNGKLDLAVIDFDSDEVSILLGNGDGTFHLAAQQYALGPYPSSIVTGDFSGDGHLDLAVTDLASNEVSVLLGNGDGTFQPAVNYAVVLEPIAIVTADFSGNGKLDVAVANAGGGISVLLGNGDGTFQPAVSYTVGDEPVSIVAGDFTGDGKLDLVDANFVSGNVSVLLGNGDGTFANASEFVTTLHATPVVADVRGDGTNDVLVVDGAGDILYRQGIPGQPGSFLPPVTVNPGNPSRDIAVVTTRGGPVLASVDARDPAISLYAWRDGGFVQVGSLSTGQLPAQIISADLDGNGFDDLVVRNAGDGTLTVFFGANFIGPVNPPFVPVSFLPVTLAVGLGVSDVQAIDTTGSGKLDLVVTNKLTGQVSVLLNLGDGVFAPPEPYRAGTGLSAIDPGGTPEVTSLEATAGVVAGSFTTGGPTDLLTINPGSNTMDVLAGLGGGRFASPVPIDTLSAAEVVRVADFTGNGVPDLAVLTANGVSIYLGNGKGGFSSPVNYDAGTDPTGLTVADLLGNGQLDLLIGNAYGDVLILVGNGDGTFRLFEPVKAAVALAVADLTGNGVLDFVFADQSLNQVSVVYGSASQNASSPQVTGNQTTGVLAPGAVLLADMNGDGIPDLVVANSGGNNVLVYPGLGNGQFGPPIGGTKGFPVGTDPTGLTVANLNGQPDLLVADTGSNDVSVLLGQGSGSSWTMNSGARVQTDAGPVAVAVGNLLGGNTLDLAVADSGADKVQVFPSAGSGFFDDQPEKTYSVGQEPSALFMGDFTGQGLGLATLNAGSNDGTLISDVGSANAEIKSFATGGNSPITGFAGDFSGNGFTDLVVGNNGDGNLALLLGGSAGLSLSQSVSNPAAPNPTAVSFGGVTDGVLSFYVSTAGHDAALEMSFNLSASAAIIGPGTAPSLGLSSVPGATIFEVARLGDVTGSAFDLLATLVTLTILPENLESELESGGGGALLASFSPGGSVGLGQGIGVGRSNDVVGGGEPEVTNPATATGAVGTGQASTPVDRLAPWAQFAVGLDQAWQELRARLVPGAAENGTATGAARIQSQAPSILAPQPDPSRSDTKSRSSSSDGTKSPLPAKKQEPAGAATNGVWKREPGAGVSVSLWSPAGFPPILAAVDAAIEELAESLPRSNHLLGIVPMTIDERSDSAVQAMMGIAAVSMAWERAVVAVRGRCEARWSEEKDQG